MLREPVILRHPLAESCLRVLRSRETKSSEFRRALFRLGVLLAVKAAEGLNVVEGAVVTPLGVRASCCSVVEERLLLVPILRAGLGFVEAFLTLLPGAGVAHIGVARDEDTLKARFYLDAVPAAPDDFDHVFLLDPMLATGNSSVLALEMITAKGYREEQITLVCALAVEQGINRVRKEFPGTQIVAAAVDPGLNERAFIVPGLGDAGDRLFQAGNNVSGK